MKLDNELLKKYGVDLDLYGSNIDYRIRVKGMIEKKQLAEQEAQRNAQIAEGLKQKEEEQVRIAEEQRIIEEKLRQEQEAMEIIEKQHEAERERVQTINKIERQLRQQEEEQKQAICDKKILKSFGKREIIKRLSLTPMTPKILSIMLIKATGDQRLNRFSIQMRLQGMKKLGYVLQVGEGLWILTEEGKRMADILKPEMARG
jgi:ATPase subunit of ABC transporter with duplicated ATPase domains